MNIFIGGCLADLNMLLSEDCKESSFLACFVNLCSANYAKYNKSPKISDSCTGNVLYHILFCFVEKNVISS